MRGGLIIVKWFIAWGPSHVSTTMELLLILFHGAKYKRKSILQLNRCRNQSRCQRSPALEEMNKPAQRSMQTWCWPLKGSVNDRMVLSVSCSKRVCHWCLFSAQESPFMCRPYATFSNTKQGTSQTCPSTESAVFVLLAEEFETSKTY